MEPTRILQRACRHMAESNDARRRQADCISRNARRNGNSRHGGSVQGSGFAGVGGQVITLGNGQIALGDCLDVMRSVPSASVDMILCDLPYGTTACSWDSVIPFAPLWSEYWRIAKPNAAVVLTAAQPFTSALIMSQIDRFKYNMSWIKDRPSNPALANKRPLNYTEDICIFYKSLPIYHPQMEKRDEKNKRNNTNEKFSTESSANLGDSFNKTGMNDFIYPKNFIKVNCQRGLHPTQKPVALFEYLIKTYTNEGDVVMDNCLGSGTTAIAAENTGRRWIGIERDPTYFGLACDRIARHLA